MRKAPTVLLLGLVVPALTALPVVSAPAPTPHPVTPEVRSATLAGVDATLEHSSAGARSRSIATAAWRSSASPTARTTFGPVTGPMAEAVSRPAVLASARHTATFSLLGVTWRAPKQPADLTVVVRAHGASGFDPRANWSGA